LLKELLVGVAFLAVAYTAYKFKSLSYDLRRTVATRLGESLGVGGEQLIKKVLGHADGSVTAIYNRYGYVKEMRAGLDAWARELTK
jgi:integrase